MILYRLHIQFQYLHIVSLEKRYDILPNTVDINFETL